MLAQELRDAFTGFFAERAHKRVPSIGLIPLHPAAPLFTNAGMNQFLPVFLGEEPPPDPPRATSVQKCVRIMGKHDDIENIGRTWGHLTFFEMLGNFSLGDYFKEEAIRFAWDFSTGVCGFDGDRIWITVHVDDDEAADIWRDGIGIPSERIVRLDDDNFWAMGDTGPCGPCSELHYDLGADYGEATGPTAEYNARYREFWNLVFLQYSRQADGTLVELPTKNIDTGAGLERFLTILQGVDSVFDTDEIRRLVAAAERVTGRAYGADPDDDIRLRILADHARSVTFLINDGVYPSNEDRGYVLRRLLRRAVRVAYQLGVERDVLPEMTATVVEVMGAAYPELAGNLDFITGVIGREEARFRQTLAGGSAMLDEELASGSSVIGGEVAFRLHDTFGFPIELTREIAAERGVGVDGAGFEAAMAAQRERARAARQAGAIDEERTAQYREILDVAGATEFTGYAETESAGRVVGVIDAGDGKVEIFLDRSPFYAEGGGQVGDTGTITTETGVATVLDTTAALTGLHRHVAEVAGDVRVGQQALAAIDTVRRDSIRRNHTGTHLLHAALREVVGGHVRQHGSLVAPDYLRFDFTHHDAVTADELDRVETMVNAHVLSNEPVRAYETTKQRADDIGAISFFDEKYGEVVRVVEAGTRSMELCGGTHVAALGSIGAVKIISEGSIGSNLRRIFALTGEGTLARIREREQLLRDASELLRANPEELPQAVKRLQDAQRALNDELKALRASAARGRAADLAGQAVDGAIVARLDDVAQDQLREMALSLRDRADIRAVVLVGTPDGQRVALVAAVTRDSGLTAGDLLAEAKTLVGGGGGPGRDPSLAMAGGRDVNGIDAAVEAVRRALGLA